MKAIKTETQARLDYKGRENTDNLLKIQNDINCAAGWCSNFTFSDGKTKGYLPALGELLPMKYNLSEINACLQTVGGDTIPLAYHWSSTYYNINDYDYRQCWSITFASPYMYISQNVISNNIRVRPVVTYEPLN